MSNFTDTYNISSQTTENGIEFFFLSDGKKDVFKMIEYSYAFDHQERKVYNLAFGDYSFKTGSFSAKKPLDVSIFTGAMSINISTI